jgi:hypothetical protein
MKAQPPNTMGSEAGQVVYSPSGVSISPSSSNGLDDWEKCDRPCHLSPRTRSMDCLAQQNGKERSWSLRPSNSLGHLITTGMFLFLNPPVLLFNLISRVQLHVTSHYLFPSSPIIFVILTSFVQHPNRSHTFDHDLHQVPRSRRISCCSFGGRRWIPVYGSRVLTLAGSLNQQR